MLAVDSATTIAAISALVAVVSAVIAGLVFRQSSLIYGRRRPIIISAPKAVNFYGSLSVPPPRADAAGRIAVVYIFNQSSVTQQFVVDELQTKILKPILGSEQPHAVPRTIVFEPHSGGNVSLAITYEQSGWPSDITSSSSRSSQSYQLRIIGMTQSGHEAKWTGWVTLTDPFWR